tara:strand:+ start:1684 stop:2571 length:888 start_codon:yes stop_codon:yes gene_type:complete
MTNSKKKIVLITGSSSGIGKTTVELLSKNNLQVIATMRKINGENSEIANELKELNENITIEDLDVTCPASIKNVVNNIIEKFKKIDVVINNAGIMNVGLAEGFTVKQIEKQMDVNYIGVARLFREILPFMKQRKDGLFITISSIAGRIIFPFLSTYNPSKFAVEALAEIYRYELSPFNIDSVIIEPGPFSTQLIDNSPRPEDLERLKYYGDLAHAPEQTMQYFKQIMKDNPDCNPKLVSEVILNLIKTEYGSRPLRTTCGDDYGVKEINSVIEKYQLKVLNKMGLDNLIPRKKKN